MDKHKISFRTEKNYNKPIHMGPYWKRMHHDWRFWVGIFFTMLALIIYIASENLSIQPAGIK